VTKAYFIVAEALAADSFENAQKAFPELKDQLDAIDSSVLESEAAEQLTKSRANMLASLDTMQSATGIESAREGLSPLSEELTVALRSFGEGLETPVYRARCPMAFQNQGAAWLQRDATVNNPYFGAMMLRCGSVLEIISEGESDTANHGGHNHE